MRGVEAMFRAELRRRWASWLALAVLVALVGGTVLAGVSAARRTSAAIPSFVARYGFDAAIYGASQHPFDLSGVRDASVISTSPAYLNGNVTAGGQFVPANDFSLYGVPKPRLSATVKLTSGRLPTGIHDALVGFSMAQQYGLHLGSIVSVPLYAHSQLQQVFSSNGTPAARGPTVRFRVVGVEASMLDFPSNSPSYSMYTSPAFDSTIGSHLAAATFLVVRLAHGAADLPRFTYAVNHLTVGGQNVAYVFSEDAQIAAIEGSIHPQAVGWWLFALFALLAGLALVAQALSRQSLVEREPYPALSAIGFRPSELFWLGMARAAAIGAAGAVGALALAVALSPLTPVGEARAAETSTGFLFDTLVFGLGAVAIAATVLVLAAYPSYRAAQVRSVQQREVRPSTHGPSRVVRALAHTGAPPSVLVGSRHALERGHGRTSVPVATALVGTAVAVAALVATAVFGASLSNLLGTPRLYGVGWQASIGGIYYPKAAAIVHGLLDNPAVTKVTYGINGKYIDVNGAPVQATLVDVAKGPMVFSLVDGRYPRADGEVALGTQSLAAAHAHVGSTVPVAVIGPSGKSRTSEFTVVGTVVLPPNLSAGGLGTGAIVTLHAAAASICPAGPRAPPCIATLIHRLEAPSFANWGMAITVVDDAAGRATVARLDRRYSSNVTLLTVPVNLVNFGQAVNFPALLGVTLALFGTATLAHLLFVSVVRRRREIALLKVLGFVRRQVGTAVCWQATTVAVIGIAFGVPAGIVLGRYVWRAYATSLGAVPVPVVPIGIVLFVVLGVVVVSNTLALVPATLAVRLRPAVSLREQ
ncbi:MAG TPA: ABC transporter permease [Acidimicrobiales bacterium]|jgi:hypothetical protein|nr:ABC transporter permease [Acidimicrobiales bacterium]